MKTKRQYSEDEKAAALAALVANGGNLKRTADELGIPRTTLRKWLDGHVHPDVTQKGHQKTEELGDVYERVSREMLVVASNKAGELTADKAILSAAIATDKMRLCREQATAIVKKTDDFFSQLDALSERHARAGARAVQADGAARTNGHAEPVHSTPDGNGQAE